MLAKNTQSPGPVLKALWDCLYQEEYGKGKPRSREGSPDLRSRDSWVAEGLKAHGTQDWGANLHRGIARPGSKIGDGTAVRLANQRTGPAHT